MVFDELGVIMEVTSAYANKMLKQFLKPKV